MSATSGTLAGLSLADSTARCHGPWIADSTHAVEHALDEAAWPTDAVRFELDDIARMDTAGAWLLQRAISRLRAAGVDVTVTGASAQTRALLELVAQREDDIASPPVPTPTGLLEDIGRHAHGVLQQYTGFLEFIGDVAVTSLRLLVRPRRIRWRLIVDELESAGVNALPIVGLLSFLMGVVIAYQGGVVLRDYGASIYIADIVGLSTVRELAPLITAIIVAGRTGSAYTAQIGTMKVTEEVDALRSVGISPLESLVVPKLAALIIALPLLTVFADAMGLFGGLVMAATMLDLNAVTYVGRLAEALTLESYLSGVGKAPVFACLIAVVGCYQGFRVTGSAASVGRQTTISVVQSIFLVLIVDAAFSVAFSKLGI